ncbi:S41 family peptidase [Niabella terrae]
MKVIVIVVLLVASLIACKKDFSGPDQEAETETVPTTGTDAEELQLLADSVFLFSKEIYYWLEDIEGVSYASFNPRKYVKSDALATARAVMDQIRTYNYWDNEKQYSYAEDYSSGSASSSAATSEKGYGFDVKEAWKDRSVNPDYQPSSFAGWFVSYVYPDSDAGKKGVKRGMRLAKVNNTNMGYTDAAIDVLNDMFYYQTLNSVEALLIQQNGDTLKVTISNTSFFPTSILHSEILESAGGNKAGYLAYNYFDKLADSQADLAAALGTFRSAGIKNIILDLRYNGGGYTATQDYLTNHLAPSGTSGTMYTYYYNKNLQTNKYTLMKTRGNYNFAPSGGNVVKFNLPSDALKPEKLIVIISNYTASSSELLINNLTQAYESANMVLIGDDNTFGKPVGFFPVDLFEKVTFWTVSFMTRNARNDSVSYEGFQPRYKIYDGVDKSWGDTKEECLAAALNYLDGKKISATIGTTTPRAVVSKKLILKRRQRLMDNMLFTRD